MDPIAQNTFSHVTARDNSSVLSHIFVVSLYIMSLVAVALVSYVAASYFVSKNFYETSTSDPKGNKIILPVGLNEKPVVDANVIYTFSGSLKSYNDVSKRMVLDESLTLPDFIFNPDTKVVRGSDNRVLATESAVLKHGTQVRVTARYSIKDKSWETLEVLIFDNLPIKID